LRRIRRAGMDLSSLLLCLLTVVLLTPGTAQAQATLQRPWAHVAAYDFSLPYDVAAVVDENGTLKLNKFNVRIYETQPPWAPEEGSNKSVPSDLLTLTSGDRVEGVVMTFSATESEGTVEISPRSVNADGTINWDLKATVIAPVSWEGNFSFTGFLAPVAHAGPVRFMWPSTVYATADGDKLEVAYVRDGELVVKEVNVGGTVERWDIVDVDDHRTVIVVKTSSGTRTVLVDRASGEVDLSDEVKVGYDEFTQDTVAVAVPEQDGAIIAVAVAGSELDGSPLYLPPLARVEVQGAKILDVKMPGGDLILAVAEVGNEITLLAIRFSHDMKPELLPVRKEREDDGEITFAVDLSSYGLGSYVLFVTYDKDKGKITRGELRWSSVTGAAVPSVDVKLLDTNLANPDAHGDVKLDLTKDIEVTGLSEIADVKVMRGSEVVTGKLYRIETTWGRFYGAVVGDRLVLIPRTVHPMLHTGDGGIVREVEVDVQPNSDGTVTVVVHDPAFGDLKVPGCVVADWSYRPRIFPAEALIEKFVEKLGERGDSPNVSEVTLGSFVRGLVTGQSQSDSLTAITAVRLPEGATVSLEGCPFLTLALKDGRLAVITLSTDHCVMYVIDPTSGNVVERHEVTAAVPSASEQTSAVTESPGIVVLVPEENAVRVLIPYPYPYYLLSALDVLPVIAEVTVPTEGKPENVQMLPLCLDDGTVMICCVWTSNGEPYALAVEASGGEIRTLERTWVEDGGGVVYLPYGDKYLRVDMTNGRYEIVELLPGGVKEVQVVAATGGEQGGEQQGGQGDQKREEEQQGGQEGQGGNQPGQTGQGQQGGNQQSQQVGQPSQGGQQGGQTQGQQAQGSQGGEEEKEGKPEKSGGKRGFPVLVPPVIPPRRKARA